MQNMKEILEEYGADYEKTMSRFMGNEDLYKRVLMKLGEDKNAEMLSQAIEEKDLDAAFGAAHTLKGVAANMGLTPLLNAVNELVEPLRRREWHEDYPELCRVVTEEFERIVALVKEWN